MSILNKMFPSAFQILLKRIVIYALCITFTHSIAQNPNNFDLVRKRAQVYKVNGKAGLNLGKKNLVPPLFDSLAPLKKGFVKVYNKDKVGVYEIGKGQVVPMLYDDLSIVNDTLLLSLLNHKRGLLSLSNKILL
ncbi:MAG TPA: hypothetical protein VL947_05365, partial [Cytophagales bacterium]|nr:hypothetical protein [Cytophagales bacterium]